MGVTSRNMRYKRIKRKYKLGDKIKKNGVTLHIKKLI